MHPDIISLQIPCRLTWLAVSVPLLRHQKVLKHLLQTISTLCGGMRNCHGVAYLAVAGGGSSSSALPTVELAPVSGGWDYQTWLASWWDILQHPLS
jgi:hypothetical protein